MVDDPYVEGAAAFMDMKSILTCPYHEEGPEADRWREGFNDKAYEWNYLQKHMEEEHGSKEVF